MADRDQPYDPYIPAGGNAGRGQTSTRSNPAAVQGELDEVVKDMTQNLKDLQERGQAVNHLQAQTDNLATSSHEFRRTGNRLRRNMWWKDMKLRLCIIAIIVIIIIIAVVVPIATKK